jgi:signal transduction histidine kinase
LPLDPTLRARDERIDSLKAAIGRLAHDFNNALVPILGYLSLAKEDLPPGGSAANFVTAAENGARKTEKVLDAILLAVYPHRKLKTVPTSLGDLIQNEVESWKRSLPPEPKIDFSLSLTPCTLDLDPHQWQITLQHLLRNATQAMPQGGRIHITVNRCSLDENEAGQLGVKPGPFCLISCRDTGPGMPADVLRTCCDPFFSTRPKSKGLGLGLTTVQSVSRIHNGQTRVSSEEGKGTNVEVWVPLV